MKETVIDIYDLQKMAPFFRTRFGTFIGKIALKYLCVNKVNQVHKNSCHLRGSEFTSHLLKDPLIDLSYTIHNEHILDNLPEGSFIVVSNHPVGSIDGIVMIDIFASRRPDFKVMVNGVLTCIGAMEDNFIPVLPDSNRQGANMKNVYGIRGSFEQLKKGHPMGFFPSGAISSVDKEKGGIYDIPWSPNVIRLIRKVKVPVYPMFCDFYNSNFFYWLSKINWKIRTLRIPVEVFNKKGKNLDVYIGEQIPVSEIQSRTDDEELAEFLYNKTYAAKPSTKKK